MQSSERRRRAILLGAPKMVPEGALMDRFGWTGNNTGNLFIGAGLTAVIDADFERGGPIQSAAKMRERSDFVAIAAANFLTQSFDMGYLADQIEAYDLPCIMIGLGAQAPRVGDKVEIPEGTRRLLQAVSERSTSIGVRGANTAQVMNDLGFKNVTVTGCPSLYRIGEGGFRPANDLSRMMINSSYNVASHSMSADTMRRVEGAIYRQAVDRGCDYVLQNEHAEFDVLLDIDPPLRLKYLKRAMAALDDVADDVLLHYIKTHCRVFFDPSEWVAYAGGRTLSLGTRFHGNIAALQAGTPALFICHDARTTEMCQFARLPHVSIEEITDTRFEALAERIDMAPFLRHRPTMHAEFAEFLRLNNVPANPQRAAA